MGDYFYEIALEDVKFVNLIARTSLRYPGCNQKGKPMSEEKSDLKGLGISFVIIVVTMVGIPYGMTFLFPT